MKRYLFLICIISLIAAVSGVNAAPPSAMPKLPDEFIELFPADLYPDFQYNGLAPSCAACPDCDPEFSFFVKGGKQNRLVVYFQGGGACWDSKNCLYAHTYYEEVPDLSAFSDLTGRGIFDTDNPDNPFKDWYFVYIPYCTGDVHWGANDYGYPDNLAIYGPQFAPVTIRHRGFVNFQVVLQWIEDNFSGPEKIFVTGSSAGGYGAILSFPFIKEAFPRSGVHVLGDAANGVVENYFQTEAIYKWDIQMPTWVPGLENGYDPSLTMEDIYIDLADYYKNSRLAQFTTAWDWNQTFFYNVMLTIGKYSTYPPPLSWVPQVEEWNNYTPVWCDWHSRMIDMVYGTAAATSNYRYYIAAGDYHTIMMSPQFYTEDSAGMPFAEWVREMTKQHFAVPGKGGDWINLECEDCADPVACP